MSLTLLVENNPRIENFYILNLVTWLGLDIVTHQKGDSAIKFISSEPEKIKLIIVRSTIAKENTARAILEVLKSKDLKIPVIVIGPGKDFKDAFAHIANSLLLKALIQAAAKALNITAKEMTSKVVPDLFPFPIVNFKDLKRAPCPVYQKQADEKYELVAEKLKDFEEAFIQKLIQNGVDTLYVNKLDRLEFVNHVTSEIMVTLEDGQLSEDEAISAADKGLELLSKKLLTIGVTEETIGIAKKSMDHMRKNAKANPKLAKLLERLLSNQTSYLFKHTQILTYVSLHIVRNIDWGNPEQEDKISFISFFHDIALESDVQASIKSTLELKSAKLTPVEKQLVERHAQIGAELVQKFPHTPMGADQIIRQHHGQLNGIGFSEHFGNNVSPVSVVFIVAEEFTRIIMKRETGPFDRQNMFKELKEEFPTSRFQKVIALLETITF